MLDNDCPDTTGRTPEGIRAMIADREALRARMRKDGTRRTQSEAYEGLGRAIDRLRARLAEATRRDHE